jgi:predicted acylesterase/phospholipase RssA
MWPLQARHTVAAKEVIGVETTIDLATLHQTLSQIDVAAPGRISTLSLAAGELLFAQGDRASTVYLLLSGRLEALTGGEEAGRVIGVVHPGELVGEVALVDGTRTATVRAKRDSLLACIQRATFEQLLERDPGIGLQVATTAARRATHARPAAQASGCIAVVAASGSVDARLFTSSVANELEGIGATAHLWSSRVDSWLDTPGAAQSGVDEPGGARLAELLADVESDHRFVVCEADATDSAWTQRVIRSADRVVLVVDATDPRDGSAVAARTWGWLADNPLPTDLVLLQPAGCSRPTATREWLALHPADNVHHVRQGSRGDLARLGRRLGGTGVGLALSGGGARGFAHLGVLRAMHELGLPTDIVAGTSMGAVIASVAAMEMTPDDMVAAAVEGFRNVLDYTVPLVSMVKGRRIVRGMQATYADRDIEDLWLTFFCISANLTRSSAVVHRRGPLVQAVRASVAIPGVIPPVPYGDDLLVDGGVLNNLPLDEVRAATATGTVVAVDVTPAEGPRAHADFGMSVSGARVAAARLLRRRHPAPGISRVLLRSMSLGAMRDRDRHQRSGKADLFLDLDLRGVDMLDFGAVAEVANRGYEAAAPRIERWLCERET